MQKSRMYEGVRTWNPFVGCRFGCIYCMPSFQRQAKRQRKNCEMCYRYEPHFHPERLRRLPKAKVIFACAFGDVFWAKKEWTAKILKVIAENPNREFYVQSKNPAIFLAWQEEFDLPDNLILGSTIETDLTEFDTPGKYGSYDEITSAPDPLHRIAAMKLLEHPKKYVTVEPILTFSSRFARTIKAIEPEFVYVGYDNHGCRLPEPPLDDTLELADKLESFTEVRLKTLREAWWMIR